MGRWPIDAKEQIMTYEQALQSPALAFDHFTDISGYITPVIVVRHAAGYLIEVWSGGYYRANPKYAELVA
jgi:hypothetical protein